MSVLPKQARLAKEELSTTHQGNNSRSIVTYAGAPVFNISNLNDGGGYDDDYYGYMHALYSGDPYEDLAALRAKERLISGTCEWLLTKKEYTTWVQERSPQVLLLDGPPGSGKTMTCSFLVDQLRRETTQNTAKKQLLYFFCDNGNDNRNTGISILRGLIWQLLNQQPGLFDHVRHYYNTRGMTIFQSFGALWRNLTQILDKISHETYILIDALDECDKSRQEFLEHLVRELRTQEEHHDKFRVKLFITCRPVSDLWNVVEDAQLSCYRRLELDSIDLHGDISKFIEAKVEHLAGLPSKRNVFPKELQFIIKNYLSQGEGTFLWASLLMRDLAKSSTALQVEEKLKSFPSSLHRIYDRTLTHIGADLVETAKDLLSCLVIARRPMTTYELIDAFTCWPESEHRTRHNKLELDMLKKVTRNCGPLVHLDSKSNTINLFHQSVRDYFLGPELSKKVYLSGFCVDAVKTNFLMFRTCWDYLRGEIISERHLGIHRNEANFLQPTYFSDKVIDSRPFLRYAISEWTQHALAVDEVCMMEFISANDKFDEVAILRDMWLLLAIEEGCDKIVELLIKKGADINVKDRYGETTLHLAAYRGRTEISQSMIENENGIDVNTRNAYGMTPLHRASFEGHIETVQLLMKKYADVGVKDFDGQTALHKAASNGYEGVVDILLVEVVDINAKDRNGQTCLHLSAYKGDETIVQMLIDKGANLDMRDSSGSTALRWAVDRGHVKIAHALMEKGANIHVLNNSGQTVLHQAACNGDNTLLQLLGEYGADLHIKDRDGWPALHRAAFNGHQTAVQLLIEQGADINAKDNDGKTAQNRAAQNRHDIIVRRLSEASINIQTLHWAAWVGDEVRVAQQIQKIANLNVVDNNAWTALHWATKKGHEAVVQMLVEWKADINMQDGHGQTGLHIAALNGHEAVVQLLIGKGADVNMNNCYRQKALHQAAMNGHQAIVQLLLERGADVNAADDDGKAAWQWAAQNRHNAVVQQLRGASTIIEGFHWAASAGDRTMILQQLQELVNINVVDMYGWTALHWATEKGHELIVRLLVDRRADLNVQDGYGQTGLHRAALKDYDRIVQVLIDNGAGIDVQDLTKSTALHWAARKGHDKIAHMLIQKGASINAPDGHGQTALHQSASNGNMTLTQLLIKYGVNIYLQDIDGRTALHRATSKGHQSIVQLLIEQGADLNAQDNRNRKSGNERHNVPIGSTEYI